MISDRGDPEVGLRVPGGSAQGTETGTPVWQVLVSGALVALSLGSAWWAGNFTRGAMTLVLLAVLLAGAGAAVAGRRGLRVDVPPSAWLAALTVVALSNLAPGILFRVVTGAELRYEVHLLLTLSPRVDPGKVLQIALLAVLLASAASVLCLTRRPALAKLAFVAGIVADLALVASRISWGQASIDVYRMIQGSTEQLLHGHNPYAAVYSSSTPGVSHLHFAYGPGVLLIAAPFRLLGDIRVADAAAMVALLVSIAILARRHAGDGPDRRLVAFSIAMPFAPFMILQAWPEVYPVAATALWLVLRPRHPRWAVIALGLGLCTVPTAAPLLALPWLWWRDARREITAAAVLALALCVPFALWTGASHFIADVVSVQLHAPVRTNALSINALLWHLHMPFLPGWLGISVSALALVAFWLSGRRDWTTAFLLGGTLCLIIFLTAKWAFFDYYFIVAYGLALSLALARGPAGWTRTGPNQPGHA